LHGEHENSARARVSKARNHIPLVVELSIKCVVDTIREQLRYYLSLCARYTHLAEELFKGEKEYISKVAKNEIDICALVDAGFEYVCDYEGPKSSENANIELNISRLNPHQNQHSGAGDGV
jgi:hypothetical protein